MCGFVGAWVLHAPLGAPPVAESALDRMRHRGPDGAAWHAGPRARLGFRRLSIIDVATGMQPLSNEDGRVVAMVNGEIYNHHELRPQLALRHDFRTRSDAEVVLHGYEEWGDSVFDTLRGMFAVVLADGVRDRLVLARDRVGKKPLYYRVEAGRVLRFASEIAPLSGDGRREVDREALNDYLRFGYVPAPRTLYAGIRKLPAGCLLVADADGRVEVRRWAPFLARRPATRGTEAQWAELIRHGLQEAVELRLESEVPLGFLLSGGVDSAGVFALGAQALPGRARAFTIGFRDTELDESAAARSVAERYGAAHTLRVVEPSEAPGLGAVVARCEEPVATDALLPTDRVFSCVKDAGITTVLAGEGSDEIFAGYRKFGAAVEAVRGAPARWSELPGTGPLGRYLSHEEFCFPSLAERVQLIGDAASDAGYEDLEAAVEHLDPLSQMLALEVALRLPDRINHRLDRLSMAYSIEARAPFMDQRLMELAMQVPHELRVRDGVPKAILRRALADDLPAPVVSAKKAPFRAPDTWFVEDTGLDPRAAAEAGLVDPTVVKRLRARVRSGDAAARERLYNLTVLHLWHRQGVDAGDLPVTSRVE